MEYKITFGGNVINLAASKKGYSLTDKDAKHPVFVAKSLLPFDHIACFTCTADDFPDWESFVKDCNKELKPHHAKLCIDEHDQYRKERTATITQILQIAAGQDPYYSSFTEMVRIAKYKCTHVSLE